MTRTLSGEDSRLINSSKSGWQTSSKCIVIEENETPSPITGAGLMAGGALLSLLMFHWMFISPVLARRKQARMQAKPALEPPSPPVMPAAFGEPPKVKASPVLGQLRILVYPLRLLPRAPSYRSSLVCLPVVRPRERTLFERCPAIPPHPRFRLGHRTGRRADARQRRTGRVNATATGDASRHYATR